MFRSIINRAWRHNSVKITNYPTCNRPVSSTTNLAPEKNNTTAGSDTKDWITIYKFPLIHAVAGVNKIKLYQAAFTSAGIPLTMFLETDGIIPDGSLNIFAALGISGTIALCVFSAIAKNCIGIVYADALRDPKMIRIAHIDFWGARHNLEVPVAELVVDEHRKPIIDMWLNVKSNKSNNVYKLFHRHGVIEDPLLFSWLFGEE